MKRTLLCILDGFGLNPRTEGNAVAQATKPNLEKLKEYPHSTLITFGERVGLPEGQMGNSEVGHLNIGAGRVVDQWLLRINKALQGTFLKESTAFQNFFNSATQDSALHLVGLYSDGGVHSHREHLHLLLQNLHAQLQNDKRNLRVVLHVITDGRDVGPNTALGQVQELEKLLASYPEVTIGTVSGRFYAMDRDKRWERTQQAYDAMILGMVRKTESASEYIAQSYEEGVTDEFILPASFGSYSGVAPKDRVLFWNFREDRMRQIGRVLCVSDFDGFPRPTPPFTPDRTLGFTEYDHTFHLPYLFDQLDLSNHLGEVLSNKGVRQLRLAETEKYAHVTYFFNGGREVEYPNETRHLIPSPRDVKTYDEKPEMSSVAVTDTLVQAMNGKEYDFIVVNFANCDMVGHTGSLPAAVKAVEAVDRAVGRILETAQIQRWQVMFIADHGNAELMVNYQTGAPHTAHTTYLVPIIIVPSVDEKRVLQVEDGGALCDVAPTLLEMMEISKPKEMTGKSLLQRS